MITLIERHEVSPTAAAAHRGAVEVGFHAARAPFLLTVHTDTIPIREDWLQYHLEPMLANERLAAVGTDKLNLRPPLLKLLRTIEDWALWWKRFRSVRIANRQPYIRSHCALYRRSILNEHHINYNDFPALTAGQGVHHELVRLGYECRLLDPREVIERVVHLEHATSFLVPELRPELRKLALYRGLWRIERFLKRPEILALRADDSLDRA